MTLQRDPQTGSQRFIAPDISTGLRIDYQSLLSPGFIGRDKPIAAPEYTPPQLIAVTPRGDRLYRGQITLRELRGPVAQEGPYEEVYASMASGDMVGETWDKSRHPFLSERYGATDRPGNTDEIYRVFSAEYLGKLVVSAHNTTTDQLYVEDATSKTLSYVTGWTVPANLTSLRGMAAVTIVNAQYLLLCYGTNTGAVTGFIQALSNLNNPPTSTVLATPLVGMQDVLQIPGTDNPIAVMTVTGSLQFAPSTDAYTALNFTEVARGLHGAGHFVGIVTLGGSAPYLAVLNPRPTGHPFRLNAAGFADGGDRADVLLFDLNGYYRGILNFPLPHVTFATPLGPGLFACDRRSHYFHLGGTNPIPVDLAQQHDPDSNLLRLCCGHTRVDGRMRVTINEIATSGSETRTYEQIWEYNPVNNTYKAISARRQLNGVGIRAQGGSLLPFSEATRKAHILSSPINADPVLGSNTYAWHKQTHEPANVLGSSLRKTHGAAAGTGEPYEPTATARTARFTSYPGLKGPTKFALARITAPPVWHIAEGEDYGNVGTDTQARLSVRELASGKGTQTSHPFDTREPEKRRPVLPLPDNNGWSDYLQFELISYQQTGAGGADNSHYTVNALPVTADVYMKVEAEPKPGDWQEWDADASGPLT